MTLTVKESNIIDGIIDCLKHERPLVERYGTYNEEIKSLLESLGINYDFSVIEERENAYETVNYYYYYLGNNDIGLSVELLEQYKNSEGFEKDMIVLLTEDKYVKSIDNKGIHFSKDINKALLLDKSNFRQLKNFLNNSYDDVKIESDVVVVNIKDDKIISIRLEV